MTDVVEIVHPTPISFLPGRARLRRLGLVRTRTPVTLTRVGANEVGPRIPIRDGRTELGFHVIEGRLFLRVDEPLPGRDTRSLLADLSRERDATRRTLLDKAIARTPVSAQLDAHAPTGRPTHARDADHRGVAAESLGPHVVERDNTAMARDALREWVARNVRLSGDGLYVDTGGPLLRPTRMGASAEFDTVAFPRLPPNRLQCVRGPFTPSEAREYRRREMDAYHHDPTPEHYGIVADDLPPEADVGRDTDALFANAVAGRLLDALSTVLRAPENGAPLEFDGIPLRQAALLGSLGLVGPESVASVCARADRVARGALGIPAVGREHGEMLNRLRDHVSEWVQARASERADKLVDEDGPDLAALAP